MKIKGLIFIIVSIYLSLTFTELALSQELRLLPGESLPVLENVQVKTSITIDEKTEIYTYSYTISNPESNTGEIWSVDIDITKPEGTQEISKEGIINGPRYAKHTSEAVLSTVGIPLIPVGLFSPANWISGLSDNSTAGWGSIDTPFRIHPGKSLSGFAITSHGLPGIRSIKIEPKFKQKPVPDGQGDADRLGPIEEAIVRTYKTIGPTAPPVNFVALDFLSYLIDLKHKAAELGWVGGTKFVLDLDKKLDQAKEKLQSGNIESARGKLKSFINKIEVQFKETKEDELERIKEDKKGKGHDDKKFVTSEGHGLLKFNAKYLMDQLGQGEPKEDKEE